MSVGELVRKIEFLRHSSPKAQKEKRVPGAGVEVLTGRGKLLDAHTIEVGAPASKTVTAKTILLCTGTLHQVDPPRPTVPAHRATEAS